MKIIETKQYIFDDEDRRLLSIELPDNPCDNCHLVKIGGCCGCPDNTKYCEIIKPYKERNILDLALKIKRMCDLQRKVTDIKTEICKIEKEIEETGIFN